ncbi:MAG: FkbM family methyltransferase [Acidimicrobiales bacterium]|jgi:FkbM family methyltransferase
MTQQVPDVPASDDPARGGGTGLLERVTTGRLRTVVRQCGAAWHHPANRGHRLAALARLAKFQVQGRVAHRRTSVPIGDHSRMWADLKVVSTIHAVVGNPPDWAPMQAWKQLLRPGDLFVDVGASAGSYSLWAADHGARVISVEPNPIARGLLTDNIALNGYPIEVVPAALGREAGTAWFTDGLGTSNHLAEEHQGTEVELRTLDGVVGDRHVRGLKIDVEGAERLVLEGGHRALAEGRIDAVQLEWNDASVSLLGEDRGPVTQLLADHGYRFFRPDDRGRLVPAAPDGYGPDIFAVAPDRA